MNRFQIATGKTPGNIPEPEKLNFTPPTEYDPSCPVHTSECITAIVNCFSKDPNLTNSKNWKRRSILKKCIGIANGGDGNGNITYRIFENVKTGRFVKVTAGNFISDVRDVDDNFFTLCKKILEENCDSECVTTQELLRALPYENLPEASDGTGGKEEVDFENCELLELTQDSITIFAGGDWQDPVEFKAVYENGCLTCDPKSAVKATDFPGSVMTTKQMLKILYGTDSPEELRVSLAGI